MTLLFTPTQLSETRVPVSCTPGAPNKGWTLGDHDLQARGMEVSALEGSLLAGQGEAGGSGISTAAQVPPGETGPGPSSLSRARDPWLLGLGDSALGGGAGGGLHHLSEDPSLPVPFLCSLSSKDRQVCGVENSTRNPLFLRRGRDLPAFAAISGTPKNSLQAESGSLECSR